MSRIELLESARGERQLDLVIANVQLVNIFTGEIYAADIGIYGDRIAVVGRAGEYHLDSKQRVDGTGKWAIPGFVDTHIHIESTMVTPANYAAAVLPFGTTTSIIDPHEIGNVLGEEGVRHMVDGSEGLPLRVYTCVPSCVPAVPGTETAGADFGPQEVEKMLRWPRVIGVAEVMDYMGVVKGSPKMLGIIEAGLAANGTIQGHSPLLMGRDLNAYVAAGIENDHELRQGDEGLEKLRLGILPLLKVSSYGNHIPNILPTLKQAPWLDIALCTDDIEPADLLANGHMDRVVREVIAHGIEPARAIRWATLNGARHYRLRDHGAIAPSYYADIVLLSSLEAVQVCDVFAGGRQVVADGRLIDEIPDPLAAMTLENSVRLPALCGNDLALAAPIIAGEVEVNAMELLPSRMTRLERVTAQVIDGFVDLTPFEGDVCYLSLIPRHGQGRGPVTVLLKGMGLQRGAFATTIAHDSHNLLVAGFDRMDMLFAVQELERCGGGVILVDGGEVLSKIELPLAGLMSLKPVAELAVEMQTLNEMARHLGVQARTPALAITGLALTVIPEVRISDLAGLMDVQTQGPLPIFPNQQANASAQRDSPIFP